MKTYNIFKAGSTQCGTIKATCITNACKSLIEGLPYQAKYELLNRQYANIRYLHNCTICSDYIVMEAE